MLTSRWFFAKQSNTHVGKKKKITLSGSYSRDVLQIEPDDLICLVSANNYVEVNYLQEGKVKKKLLRSTTKKMHEKLPNLVRTHRSYLINPIHFVEWKNKKTIVLSHLEVPVSEKYKDDLTERIKIHP